MNSTKRISSQGESDHERRTNTQKSKEKGHVRNSQLWSKYFEEKPSVNGTDLRERRTPKVRQLGDNRYFWRGLFDGDGKGRRQ